MTTALTPTGYPLAANAGDYALIETGTTDKRLIELWLHKPRKTQSPHTQDRYQRVVTQFYEAVDKPLQHINLADLQTWANALEGSPHTRKSAIAVIKSLFSFAHQVGYLRLNPAKVMETPTVPETKSQRVVGEEAVIKLIHHAGSPRNESILRTLYSSGCRVSELCNLRWKDVTPTVEGKAELHIVGKGGKSRKAGISAETYALLLSLRGEVEDNEPVFLTNRGNAIDRVQVHRIIKQARERAGVKKAVSAHWFRHAHASHALERGANPVAVQEQLGHSSLAITTGYAHASDTSADYLVI